MHKVKVKKHYLNSLGVRAENGHIPWKWMGHCSCGWVCMSWQWIAEDRPGGALPMALAHAHRLDGWGPR